VTAVHAGKIEVNLAGTKIDHIPCIQSYHPNVGDRAWLLHQGSTLVAIGATT
jgi:hypothetical protein